MDFDKIRVRNTTNHDFYPPKILCKSNMILIGFCNLKIVKVVLLEENIEGEQLESFDFSRKSDRYCFMYQHIV